MNDYQNHDKEKIENEASSASKLSIKIFTITFLFSIIFLENTANIFSATLFFFAGIFFVSIVIAMPLFNIGKFFPVTQKLLNFLIIPITSFVTFMIFSYFFTNPLNFPPIDKPVSTDFLIKCEQPIPEFTLGGDTVLSSARKEEICACIWNSLEDWAKEISIPIVNNQEESISETKLRLFIGEFRRKLEACM